MIKQTIAALLLMTGAASALVPQVEINQGGTVEIESTTTISGTPNGYQGYLTGCDIRFSNGKGVRVEHACEDQSWDELGTTLYNEGRTLQLESTGNVDPTSSLANPVLLPNTLRIVQVFSWELTVDGIRLRQAAPRVERILSDDPRPQTGISHVGTDRVWEDNERTAVRQDIIDNHFNQCQAPRG